VKWEEREKGNTGTIENGFEEGASKREGREGDKRRGQERDAGLVTNSRIH